MNIGNPLVRLHEGFVEIRPALDTVFQGDAQALRRVDEAAEKLAKDAREGKLSTLVFGHYNAGKSTFINALLGREVAPMGDVPLTAKISKYDWNGHVIFDSPGIDAPIEHEAVTEGFIRTECNAVIFVISTGGAIEEAATWERLCSFVREKKAVLIVINDKAGMELNGAEFVRIRNVVYQNMLMAARKLGMNDPLDSIDVSHVKAKTALKAHLENKPGLLAATGIPEAEAVLSKFLGASTDKILQSDAERVRKLVNEALSRLAEQSGNDANLKLTACRNKVEQERARLERGLVEEVRALATREVGAIQEAVARIDAADEMAVTALLTDALGQSQSRIWEGVDAKLAAELERTDIVVREAGKLLSQFVGTAKVQIDEVELKAAPISPNGESDDPDDDRMSRIFEQLKSAPVGEMTENGVKQLLKYGKEWFPKLFRGIGKKTMGKWAGVAGKAAGPILMVGQAGWELLQAQKEEAQARDNHRLFVQNVMSIVRQALDDTTRRYEQKIKEVAKTAVNPVLEALDRRTTELYSQGAANQALQERLAGWSRGLDI